MSQNDLQMALLLQQQYEHEALLDSSQNSLAYTKKTHKDATKSLTDPSWELIDPTPDIHVLFIAFNEKYFWKKLLAVCVDWSKRMTTCAGICSYQGKGGMCRITLSEPLLKLRPRKDLIETLLHEMIHAYLFVTHNNKDRDGHGPEFHKHMNRINSEAGTKITVYHDFHDEVRLYKQHWWRCDGPCQKQKPYFGMVRRATNRAPGKNDFWWTQHQQNCGGSFIKVQEPPKTSKKKPDKENKIIDPKKDIRNFYPVIKGKVSTSAGPSVSINIVVGFKDLNGKRPKNATANSSSTIVINKKPTQTKKETNQSEPIVPPKVSGANGFSGKGQALGKPDPNGFDYAAVRNHWNNKFPNQTLKRPSNTSSTPDSSKRAKPTAVDQNQISPISSKPRNVEDSCDSLVPCPVCQHKYPINELNVHLDHCLEQSTVKSNPASNCPICDNQFDADVMNSHVEDCLSKTFNGTDEPTDGNLEAQNLISCLVCNKQITRGDLNSHLDECMGGDNIFNNSSANCDDDETKNDPDLNSKISEEKYNCPVCFQMLTVSEMCSHLDKCLLDDDETSKEDSVLNCLFDESF